MSHPLDLESLELPRGIDLPYEDDQNMESWWHVCSIWLLADMIHQHFLGRTDYVVGGSQFFYFDPKKARNTNFRGPDFYFVKNVPQEPIRRSWVVWEEGGRVPNVIIELLSESTAEVDRGEKKQVYLEQLDVQEYYCYDPDGPVIEGWRKGKRKPIAIQPENGRLWSNELQLSLGTWEGVYGKYRDLWPRFFDANGDVIPTADEVAQQQIQSQRVRANRAIAKAAKEQERAEAEAIQATQEVARLRAELDALKKSPPPTS